jgi:transcriptional regulator with XRE-family HTH domain
MPVLSRLQQLRRDRGISIPVLARRTGVAPTTIRSIELGYIQPSVATIARLAEALGVSPEELVGPSPEGG